MNARVIRRAAAVAAASFALVGSGLVVSAGHNSTPVAAGCAVGNAASAVNVIGISALSPVTGAQSAAAHMCIAPTAV